MGPKFLAFLLFGMLAFVAFAACWFPARRAAVDNTAEVTAMDGPGLYPPVKAF